MANPTRKNPASRPRAPHEIPRRPRAACDGVLADYLRDATGKSSLEAIRLWHASAVLLEKRAAGIIGKWAYEQFERAAEAHDAATFKMLIAQQLLPLAVTLKTQFRPLHAAAKFGFKKGIPLLLDAGADINAGDKWGYRPLNVALINRQADIAQLLLSRGADTRPILGDSSLMMTVASRPGVSLHLLPQLICRHSDAVPVADQVADAKRIAEVFGNLSVIAELERLAFVEANPPPPAGAAATP